MHESAVFAFFSIFFPSVSILSSSVANLFPSCGRALSLLRAHVDARGVAVEAFDRGEGDDGGRVGGEAGLVVADDAAALQELVHTDAAGEAGGGVCREAVARAGDVVARGDGAVRAEEDRAGVLERERIASSSRAWMLTCSAAKASARVISSSIESPMMIALWSRMPVPARSSAGAKRIAAPARPERVRRGWPTA